MSGYKEALAWNHDAADNDVEDHFQAADLTPAGVLGWLTVGVMFDHDCLARNPSHTICFPLVRACGREITFPVNHMKSSEDFRNVFLLAYCIRFILPNRIRVGRLRSYRNA